MENLVLLIKLNTHLVLEIETGRSIYSGLITFIKNHPQQKGYASLVEWVLWFEEKGKSKKEPTFKHTLTQNYFEVIKEGLSGLPVLDKFKELQREILDQIELELQKELNRLPYYLMFPLVFFIFPAFLTLILGPILEDVLKMG